MFGEELALVQAEVIKDGEPKHIDFLAEAAVGVHQAEEAGEAGQSTGKNFNPSHGGSFNFQVQASERAWAWRWRM